MYLKTLLTNTIISVFLLLFVSINVSLAQSGTYLISKHYPKLDKQNVYYDGVINNAGTTLLASRNGLIKYDGNRAVMINTGGSVFDIAISNHEESFIGTSVGLFQINKDNELQNLMPLNDRTSINQILSLDKGVYASSDNTIYYRSYGSGTTLKIQEEHAGRFYNIYELDNHVYVNSENKGALEIIDNNISSTIPVFIEKHTVLFSTQNIETKEYILGTSEGLLFHYKDGQPNLLKINEELEEAEPSTAEWYNDETIIVGTLTGGMFFVNTKTAKIETKVDYNSGLDDNEVLSLIVDKNMGVSAIGNYCLTHVSPNIPIKNFQYYDGLVGDISSTSYHEGKLYVGTNVGLYHLEQITDYEEVISYKKRRKKKTIPQVEIKRKKGLFGFKRRKNKNKKIETEKEVVVTEKQVTKKITDIYYTYKEIDERISNVSQILSLDDQLIVGGLSGVFKVSNGEAEVVTEYDTRYLYLSDDHKKLFVCTGDQQVLVFLKQGDQWIYKDVFTDFRAQVSHIKEYGGHYWLCGRNEIYKMQISNNYLEDVEEYTFENPYYSKVYSVIDSGELNFINTNGIFKIEGDSIVLKDNLSKVDNLVVDNQNEVWAFSEGTWHKPNEKNNTNPIFKILNDLKSITYVGDQNTYWVVTSDNKLIKFSKDAVIPTSSYIPYLEETQFNAARVVKDKFIIKQDENKLLFVVSYADLPHIFDTQYRYQLKGLDDSWSEWSTESAINFAFLPAGNYTLSIEAKNALDEVHKINPVKFEVLPPYWKQPLFYVFEFAVVVCLFLLSITLKSWGYKYRLLSRLLAFLTLVIIMEYLEAILESYFLMESSPVFSFSLQVIMAMIILPFEGILKKYVFKENISLKTYFELKGKKDFGES